MRNWNKRAASSDAYQKIYGWYTKNKTTEDYRAGFVRFKWVCVLLYTQKCSILYLDVEKLVTVSSHWSSQFQKSRIIHIFIRSFIVDVAVVCGIRSLEQKSISKPQNTNGIICDLFSFASCSLHGNRKKEHRVSFAQGKSPANFVRIDRDTHIVCVCVALFFICSKRVLIYPHFWDFSWRLPSLCIFVSTKEEEGIEERNEEKETKKEIESVIRLK